MLFSVETNEWSEVFAESFARIRPHLSPTSQQGERKISHEIHPAGASSTVGYCTSLVALKNIMLSNALRLAA